MRIKYCLLTLAALPRLLGLAAPASAGPPHNQVITEPQAGYQPAHRLIDAATARGVEATFAADFMKKHRPPCRGVVPKGSELIWSPGAEGRLVRLIGTAHAGSTLWLEDEQLASDSFEQALVAAAARGATVNLTMTDSSD